MYFKRTKTIINRNTGRDRVINLELSNYEDNFENAKSRFLTMLTYDLALYKQIVVDSSECNCVIDKDACTYFFRIKNVEIQGEIKGLEEISARLYDETVDR